MCLLLLLLGDNCAGWAAAFTPNGRGQINLPPLMSANGTGASPPPCTCTRPRGRARPPIGRVEEESSRGLTTVDKKLLTWPQKEAERFVGGGGGNKAPSHHAGSAELSASLEALSSFSSSSSTSSPSFFCSFSSSSSSSSDACAAKDKMNSSYRRLIAESCI